MRLESLPEAERLLLARNRDFKTGEPRSRRLLAFTSPFTRGSASPRIKLERERRTSILRDNAVL